jgi:GAF domain
MFLRGRMNTPSNPDFESLQQLLANAFAVQESQIHPQSLADIMRVQRLVESGKLNLDGAMRQIVESARKVANASGAAIALVSGDHLTYRAASGTSSVCIGWSVAASLTVAAGANTNREILRVENSLTDTRIQADICRQFGAGSLLILPIYLNGGVAGVLDIRFSEPHAFQDGEVRTYRLMAEQIETALCHPAQIEPAENRVAEMATVPEPPEEVSQASASFVALPDETFVPSADEELIPPVDESLVLPPDFRMLPENEHSLYARCGAVMADIQELPVFKQFVWLANQLTQPVRHIRWTPRRRGAPLTAAVEMPSVPRRTAEHTAVRASIPRQRVKTVTWPSRWRVSYLAAARELSNALSSSLQHTVLRTTALTQRAKNLTWPTRWRNFAGAAAAELSSTFRRSILRAAMFKRRAQGATWPSRWRNLSLVAAAELSSTFRRSVLRATKFGQHAKTLGLPIRRRRSSGVTGELSSFLKRSGLMMATLARRATNLVVLNPRRRLALETIAIVLAFAALVVYKGRVPAGSLESSTLSHSPAIEQQARPAEPLPADGEFAAKPSPAESVSESRHTSNALKRVQIGKNEVDYVADDVTMRVFTPKPAAKRSRTPDNRTAQFGDDVTVRYFAPSPTPARTTTR